MKAMVYIRYGPPDVLELKAGVSEFLGAVLSDVPIDTIFVHPKQLAAYAGIAPAPYQPRDGHLRLQREHRSTDRHQR